MQKAIPSHPAHGLIFWKGPLLGELSFPAGGLHAGHGGEHWGSAPSWPIAGSGHLQTTHLHLSFCISDVFVKQLDVSELDRSALLRS